MEHNPMTTKNIALAFCLATAALSAEQGWYPHEGGLMKYRVNIRFGEEPEDTMPAGWKFGRVSAVATNPAGTEVYVFQRGKKADPLIVFDSDNGDRQVIKFTSARKLLFTLGIKGKPGADNKTFNRPPTSPSPKTA